MRFYLTLGVVCLMLAGCAQSVAPPASTGPSAIVDWSEAKDQVNTFYVYKNGQKIFPQPVSVTSFIDKDLAIGVKYCYNVTAVQNGLESEPSNTECVTIPTGK